MLIQSALLCDAAQDYNGKLCLLGSFDTILAPRFPMVHPACSVAIRLTFRSEDEGTHRMKLLLIDEDGRNILPKIEASMDIKMPSDVFFYSRNIVFNLQQTRFDRPGQYSIDLLIDDQICARIPLQIVPALQGKTGPTQSYR